MGSNKGPLGGRLRRFRKLVGVSARTGASLLADQMRKASGKEGTGFSPETAERIVQTLGEMKGVALKLGQTLAIGQAGQGVDAAKNLFSMFSSAPPMEFEQVRDLVKSELGGELEEFYRSFEATPFAAASLGQVHLATLLSGERVAVKVQYPGVENTLEQDLKNIRGVVNVVGGGFNLFESRSYFEEAATEVRAELDYVLERERLEAFTKYLEPWPVVKIPKVYSSLCTSRVLTLEWLNGKPLHTLFVDSSSLSEERRLELGKALIIAVYGPFMTRKAIHADTHPGNYLALEDGRLGMLDFGCVKHFSHAFWLSYRNTIDAALRRDFSNILEITRSGGFRIELEDKRAEDILIQMSLIAGEPFASEYDFGKSKVPEKLREFSRKHVSELVRMRPPPEAVMFFRAISGVTENLRMLGAKGDFRPTFQMLLDYPTV